MVADGAEAPSKPLAASVAQPNVFVDGRKVDVSDSGLAPGFVGVWQINAQIPADQTIGSNVETVVLLDTNLVSNPVKIAVE